MHTKKTKNSQTGKFSGLKIINHDIAGIDVGSTLMQVCVPSDRAENNNRGHVDILHGDFVLKIEGWTFCMVEPIFSAHGR